MSQSGTVGMDRYWNYIATPLFFIVISFGVFALFTAKDIHLIEESTMRGVINLVKQAEAGASSSRPPSSVAAPVKAPRT